MEFHISFFQVLIAFFLPLVLFIATRKTRARNVSRRVIPGPWKLPWIGNLHQLAVSDLLHRTLRDLASKHGPIMHLQLGQVSTLVISSPEMAREIMKTHDLGNYWRHLRKICNEELLSAARVGSFQLIREGEQGQPLGRSAKIKEAFISTVSEETKVNSGFFLSEFFPSLKFVDTWSGLRHRVEKIHGEADRIIGNIVNDHKEKRARARSEDIEDKEDLVDVLLRLQEVGQFPSTDNNVKAIIFDLFSGGSETSSTVVDWAMAEIIKNPTVMRKAQAEVREAFQGKGNVEETGIHQLKYLKCVIKETLRLHPVFPLLLPRECSQSCEVNGFQIPTKTRVMINAWAIGRDPNHCSSHSGVDEGYVRAFLFAPPNVELPLAQLLFHFDWKLPVGMKEDDFDMTEAFGLSVRRKNELVLVPTPYPASVTVT
ncbi:hypothetical protein F3Y22_tig00111402pilonHSYRG00904 [Hibiscus syriacus]|uniref:Uncharacterized protein n=1 Tax=Hibiscus syriacus TaxID=106335 RepID=A0A6A2YKP9_HIBSY|nr:hypothetical protein F3Y22_tig00111402pilonHSYRG00904 [Hibiscus syriacus]